MARQSKKVLTADLAAMLKLFPTQFAKLDNEHKALEDQMTALKKAGLIYATAHYRPKVRADGLEVHFLYLLYPSKGEAKRKREYVGSDPAKVKKALEAIERGKQYDEIAKKAGALTSRIASVREALESAKAYLAGKAHSSRWGSHYTSHISDDWGHAAH